MMKADMNKLLQRRRAGFRKETFPYWSYVLRSGFPGFVIMLLVVCSIVYAGFLKGMPSTFPVLWVCLALLLPVLQVSPVRTYMAAADSVYLLPLEWKMDEYIRSCLLRSAVIQWVQISVVWGVLFPMYSRSADLPEHSFYYIWVVLLAVKSVNLLGSWAEVNIAEPLSRKLYQGVRLICNAAALYVLLAYTGPQALLFIVLVWAVYMAGLRFFRRYKLHWSELINREQRHRGAYFRFFSWFTDVSELPVRLSRRRWLEGWTGRIPFEPRNTFYYLYTKTITRTELSSIVIRITLIGAVGLLLFRGPWAQAGFTAAALWLAGVQLSALDQHHRFVFWTHIYPLQPEYKTGAMAKTVLRAHTASAGVLLLTVLFTSQSLPSLCFCVILCIGFPLLYNKRLIRKWSAEDYFER
ncbi:ABC transporter permease [Paenibacillus gansuensis]|uniref:ABC transporter permease n=1 Tax=Paenibacillus gansuensis TaxID=306542 RepID=A0ABW5PAK9_9BACL